MCLVWGTLPVPFNPSSRLVSVGFHHFVFFPLQNIYCMFFPFSPASHHLGNPTSCPLFSCLPYSSVPFSPMGKQIDTCIDQILKISDLVAWLPCIFVTLYVIDEQKSAVKQ